MKRNKNNQTFGEWMTLVESAIENKIGLNTLDLPDYDFYDAFDSGKCPATTAAKCIRNAGTY